MTRHRKRDQQGKDSATRAGKPGGPEAGRLRTGLPSLGELRALSPLPPRMGRRLMIAAATGIVAGLGAIVFQWMLAATSHLTLDRLAGHRPGGAGAEHEIFEPTDTPFRPFVLVLLPALGGLAAGWIVRRWAPEATGHGTDSAIEAYHHRDGAVRARVPVVKAVATALVVGTGGSGGPEGPIAQMGAGVGSQLALRLGLDAGERRTLMAAGMSAGIGAYFHAPLAGALFAAEVLYRDMDFEHEVLVPAFISSIVAYSVFALRSGWEPLFLSPPFVFDDPRRLLLYLALACVVAFGAVLFVRVFESAQGAFARLPAPEWIKPGIGGLGVGLISLLSPRVLGSGDGLLQEAILWSPGNPAAPAAVALLGLALLKIVATSLSIGSGGSGGVFGPAIVIGGCLGAATGIVATDLFPGLHPNPGAFAIVGAAGFFATAAHTPVSTILMVSEMTGNYRLLVPTMMVCMLGSIANRRWTIYPTQLFSRLDAPTKTGDMLGAVLRRSRVGDVARRPPEGVACLRQDAPLRDLLQVFAGSEQACFPVLDAEGRMAGCIDDGDLRRAIHDLDAGDIVVAGDLTRPAVVVFAEDPVLTAVAAMARADRDEAVVTSSADPSRPIAILERSDVLRAYDRALEGRRGQ